MMSEHIPVLLNEVIDGLNIREDGTYLDCTLGRAGHSSEILKRLKNGLLIGLDQDIDAIRKSEEVLKSIGGNYKIIKTNFKDLTTVLENSNIPLVDGILMDLGVSSPQFDEKERGFSYREDGPLDMRMDKEKNFSAYNVVNQYSVNDLTRIFKEYGDERFAFPIAKNIIKARQDSPIETTFQLVDIIKKSKPSKELKKEGHPAKQVFQAIRIEVNDELNVLKEALEAALKALRPHGGRLAVITFHSGEDKIVKSLFKEASVSEGSRLDLPIDIQEKEYQLITRKPITASEAELAINRRSKSAKLRIIERK